MTRANAVVNYVFALVIVPEGLLFVGIYPLIHVFCYTGNLKRGAEWFAEVKVKAVTGMTDEFSFNKARGC